MSRRDILGTGRLTQVRRRVNWFITGVAGFIGSNLSARLVEQGQQVVGFDNFLTGNRENVARIHALGGSFTFVEGDVRDASKVAQAIRSADRVVHLAAQVSVQKSFANVAQTNEINVNGFLNVLTAAAGAGVRVFVYATSCSVYGDAKELPIAESARPNPLSPYAASKLTNEAYAASLDTTYPTMRMIGLRLFNIYGPWQDPAGEYAAVIPKWIDRLLQGAPAVIFGDGTATRDFCCVGNVCRLVEALGNDDNKAPHGVYNIGTGAATSLNQLYTTISELLRGDKARSRADAPEYQPWRLGDILHSQADIVKARRELGYQPVVDLRKGLATLLREQYGM